MSTTRCDFCGMALKSDLDVSKHLVSQSHRDNVAKAITLQPCKETVRVMPKNIARVFETLKLRTVKDVKNLTDKGYFRIPRDSQGAVKVADQLIKVFLKCIAEHKLKDCSPETRRIVMDSFETVKVEAESSKQQPAHQQQKQVNEVTPEPTRNTAPLIGQPQLHAPIPQVVRPQAPILNATSAQGQRERAPVPRAPTPQAAVPRMPEAQQAAKSQPPRTGGPRVQAPVVQTSRPDVPSPQTQRKAQPVRPPASRPRDSAPQQTVSQAQRPQGGPRPQGNRPNAVSQAPRLPPSNQQRIIRPTRPPTNPLPPPSQMPMAGASFMPRQPCNDDAPPRPRLDSTYRPQLARIKVEPRDD